MKSALTCISAAAYTAYCFALFSKLRVGKTLDLGKPYFNPNPAIHLMQNLVMVV